MFNVWTEENLVSQNLNEDKSREKGKALWQQL